MIAVETNILVYAHRQDAYHHSVASARVRDLATSGRDWLIPWPCIHEFLAIVTHPRIYLPPTTIGDALRQVELWCESPRLTLAGEAYGHLARLRGLTERSRCIGPKIHDARVAAICLEHGVDVLWTADRDFSLFPELATENPMLEA